MKTIFTIDEVEKLRKEFSEEKITGKTQRIKTEELESLLLYGVSKTRDRV